MGRGKTPKTPADVIAMRNSSLFLFGQNLRAARVKKNMNQSDLNQLLGYTVNNSRLSKIENGELSSITLTTMMEVAYHLGMKIEIKLMTADKPKERKEVTFEKKESRELEQKAGLKIAQPNEEKEEPQLQPIPKEEPMKQQAIPKQDEQIAPAQQTVQNEIEIPENPN